MELEIYTDGASRGNPGHAGIGIIILDKNGKIIEQSGEYIGQTTNNVAEYKGLVSGLKIAKKYLPCSVTVHLDSELVVRQLQGKYRTKDQTLKAYFEFANQMLSEFDKFEIKYVPREKNKAADKLANQAIDKAANKKQLVPESQLMLKF
ncbi:MAG: ribonuclease HI family protein [Elusimicrobia bacterium]|nr:ribonuclease HI family protein [Elusimicrobiota bacterium]